VYASLLIPWFIPPSNPRRVAALRPPPDLDSGTQCRWWFGGLSDVVALRRMDGAAGDWLQGPYVYYLYSQYGFDKGDIGRLFIAGFGSSMLFGTIVGSLADKKCVRLPSALDEFSRFLRSVLVGLATRLMDFGWPGVGRGRASPTASPTSSAASPSTPPSTKFLWLAASLEALPLRCSSQRLSHGSSPSTTR
jgi:hypothetical protein